MNHSLSTQESAPPTPKYEPSSAATVRKLRVLVLDEEMPYPPNAGKRIRTWNLLRTLAERHSIRLMCYGYPDDPAAAAVQKAGISLCLVEPKATLAGWRLYGEPDTPEYDNGFRLVLAPR